MATGATYSVLPPAIDYSALDAQVKRFMLPDRTFLTVTRTYHPQNLPRYVDTDTRTAEDKYAVAIPKVEAEIAKILSPSLCTPYSTRSVVQRNEGFLFGHSLNTSYLTDRWERGETDPYENRYWKPGGHNNPIKPFFNDPFNGHCRGPKYLMPFLNDKMLDPRNWTGNNKGDATGTLHRNCMGKYPTMRDRVAELQAWAEKELEGFGSVCEYKFESSESVVGECMIEAGNAKFAGIEGPFTAGVEEGRRTRVEFRVCFEYTSSKWAEVIIETITFFYNLYIFPLGCVGWRPGTRAAEKYKLGGTRESYENGRDCETIYGIDIGYDDYGCPYIKDQGWNPPRQGSSSGHWEIETMPGTEQLFHYKIVNESEIPADWLNDTSDEAMDFDTEVFESFSPSAIRRSRS